jgi:hypothetical protein
MSIYSNAVLTVLVLARVASAEPAETVSFPWQLHPVTSANLISLDSSAAVFRDYQGNIDIASASTLSLSYRLTERWAPMLRLGFVGNNAPGAALDGSSLGNPVVGATYTRPLKHLRLAVFGALALPVGSGGGDAPDLQAATTNTASITARPADEAMFEVNYATVILGADLAYVKKGFTAQAEATLLQGVRVRGADTAAGAEAARTRATLGAHLGMFLGRYVSLGADLDYRRWLTSAPMLDEMTGFDRATLTAAVGVRVHVRIASTSLHPGLSYTRGFDGLTLHGPTTFTQQTNAIAVSIPATF